MANLSNDAVNRLMVGLGSAAAGKEVATAINQNSQHAVAIAALVIATSTSQTTDFGVLKVGDQVLMVPATAGSADLITITVVGTLGQAAVVGNAYLVLRAFDTVAATPTLVL